MDWSILTKRQVANAKRRMSKGKPNVVYDALLAYKPKPVEEVVEDATTPQE
jgi:hypothetical protein